MIMDTTFICVLCVSLVLLLEALAVNSQVGNNNKASVICKERERQSLLSLKQGFFDRNESLSSWGKAENQRECCKWKGVSCNNQTGDVVRLELGGYDLEGTIISSSLSELCHLEYLDLSDNHLSGSLDDFFRSLSHCANQSLKYLYLNDNQFNGSLSDFIGKLSNLEGLSIRNNLLKGVISETHFLRLSRLQYLDMSFNDLAFNVSSNWVPPFQLDAISLASCKLGPTFPKWLQTQKCTGLDISSAEISDTLPNWFWNILSPDLFGLLNLSHNQITGQISDFPSSFSHQNIMSMDLSSNLFEGQIPSNFSTVPALDLSNNKFTDASNFLCPNETAFVTYLDLSNNQLSGVLTNCWTYFAGLIFFDVTNNNLFGQIPTSIGSMRNIRGLHLGNNRFSSEIPLSLNNCTELTTLDLSQNNFSGLIPSWVGDGGGLQKLRILNLKSNMFHGSLPPNICHLSQVQILDLSKNQFSGHLPKCLSNISAMVNTTSFDATIEYANSFNSGDGNYLYGGSPIEDSALMVWKGKEFKYQSILGLVKSIDLSSNIFEGEIPSEMMDLAGLVSLNISRNKLSGEIPQTIGHLKLLDSLDLSRNLLSGKIPSELSDIDRLSVMDLSFNNLSGEIPRSTQLQSFDVSTYMGNFDLCGAPLPECITHKPNEGDEDEEDDDDDDDEQFLSQGFFISLTLGFSTGFWGICNLLYFKKSWRYAYYKIWNDAHDKVYVMAIINKARFRRWIEAST